eukprot:scaffold8.g1693.t1
MARSLHVAVAALLCLLAIRHAAGEGGGDSVHTVATIECTSYFTWQIIGLAYSHRRSGQPGNFTVLMSCTEELWEALPEADRAFFTNEASGIDRLDTGPRALSSFLSFFLSAGDPYPGINKPVAVADWLAKTDVREEFVLIVDADMVLRGPLLPEVSGFTLMHREDLRRMAPHWLRLSEDAWNLTGDAFAAEGDRPWIAEIADPRATKAGLFAHPPRPSAFNTSGYERLRDLLAIEARFLLFCVLVTVNAAFCERHRRRCPPSAELERECGVAEAIAAELSEAFATLELPPPGDGEEAQSGAAAGAGPSPPPGPPQQQQPAARGAAAAQGRAQAQGQRQEQQAGQQRPEAPAHVGRVPAPAPAPWDEAPAEAPAQGGPGEESSGKQPEGDGLRLARLEASLNHLRVELGQLGLVVNAIRVEAGRLGRLEASLNSLRVDVARLARTLGRLADAQGASLAAAGEEEEGEEQRCDVEGEDGSCGCEGGECAVWDAGADDGAAEPAAAGAGCSGNEPRPPPSS